ncbi:MAG TPA: hypothetical protein PLU75_02095 [Oscillospiraceae bacterium]|nr:hypothetical protein [Oscillospiraceae bacterium]
MGAADAKQKYLRIPPPQNRNMRKSRSLPGKVQIFFVNTKLMMQNHCFRKIRIFRVIYRCRRGAENALKFRFQKAKAPARPQSSHKIKDFLRTDEKGIDSLSCMWYIKHVNMNSCSYIQMIERSGGF